MGKLKIKKLWVDHPLTLPPERLPEQDAFLYSTNYDGWIKIFLTSAGKPPQDKPPEKLAEE
jgi:hypothetical protein